MRRLLVFVCLLASACTSALPAPSVSPQPSASPAPVSAPARPGMRTVGLVNGLVIDIPESWTIAGAQNINRVTQRLLLAGNGDPASLPVMVGNGDLDTAALPSGRVTIEVESFCGFSCGGPQTETDLPPDWTGAGPLYPQREIDLAGTGRHEKTVPVRWFDRPFFIVARWSDDAPAADIAAISLIAHSFRADPPLPATGEFHGWAGLGPIASIPVGGVQLMPLPLGAIIRPPDRLRDNEPFFLVREGQRLFAFSSKPSADRRCVVAFDAPSDHFTCTVDGRTFAWTRLGTYLGPEPASDMRPLNVIVRDGSVWVAYSD